MKQGILLSARTPLVLGRDCFIEQDEIVVFFEIAKKGAVKEIHLLSKYGLINHKVRADVDAIDCMRYWFYETI